MKLAWLHSTAEQLAEEYSTQDLVKLGLWQQVQAECVDGIGP